MGLANDKFTANEERVAKLQEQLTLLFPQAQDPTADPSLAVSSAADRGPAVTSTMFSGIPLSGGAIMATASLALSGRKQQQQQQVWRQGAAAASGSRRPKPGPPESRYEDGMESPSNPQSPPNLFTFNLLDLTP